MIDRREFVKVVSTGASAAFAHTGNDPLLVWLKMLGHQPPEPGHPENPFLVPPIAEARTFGLLQQALGPDATRIGGRFQNCGDVLYGLQEHFRTLDWLAAQARGFLIGDVEAGAAFHSWVEQRTGHDRGRTIPSVGSTRSRTREVPTGGRLAPVELPPPLVNVGPLVDIFLSATLAGGLDVERGRAYADTVLNQVILDIAFLGAMTNAAERLGRGEDVSASLTTICNQFGRTFPQWPNPGVPGPRPPFLPPTDMEVCIGAIHDAMLGPRNPVTQQMQVQVDQTQNPKIMSVSPKTICAGQILTISASKKKPFDKVAPLGLEIIFKCDVSASILSWSALAVTVRVPEAATSGPVYFGHTSGGGGTTGAGTAFLNDLADACPMLGGGGHHGSIGIYSLQKGIKPCIGGYTFADGRNVVTIVHSASIDSLDAFDASGLSVAGRTIEACSTVNLKWQVTSDDPVPPAVEIRSQGTVIASGLSKAGTFLLRPRATQVLTLHASNSCGAAPTRSVNVAVAHALHFTPEVVRVLQGDTALLTVELSCEVAGNSPLTVNVASSNPAMVSVPATVTVAAGKKTTTIPVTGLSPGQPMAVTAVVGVTTPSASGGAVGGVNVWVENRIGQWSTVLGAGGGALDMGMVPVHAAMLHTGKVLFFGADETDYANVNKGKSRVWNPVAPTTFTSPPINRNLFCAGQCMLPDGKILVAAGQSSAQSVLGSIGSWFGFGAGADHDMHIFDPATESWAKLTDLASARWYPTCVTLPNGKALIVSGYAAHAHFTINDTYEIFDPATGTLTAPQNFLSGIDLYPFVHVIPNGGLFVHSTNQSRIFLPSGASTPLGMTITTKIYPTNSANRRTYNGQGACVLLPILPSAPALARFLVVGGPDETKTSVDPNTIATDTAEIFDASPAILGWRKLAVSMWRRRFMSDAVLLPDATVLVVNGSGQGQADDNSNPVMEAELFEPATETWRQMAAMTIQRRYHSVALLLPSGQVLTAGSTGGHFGPSGGGAVNEKRLELFTPPYLFRGPRPVITSAPSSVGYSQLFDVGTPDPASISAVALVRLGTTTHTNNMDQRYLGLDIRGRPGSRVTIMSPVDATYAPPGWYMLFILDSFRVPSVARFLQVA